MMKLRLKGVPHHGAKQYEVQNWYSSNLLWTWRSSEPEGLSRNALCAPLKSGLAFLYFTLQDMMKVLDDRVFGTRLT